VLPHTQQIEQRPLNHPKHVCWNRKRHRVHCLPTCASGHCSKQCTHPPRDNTQLHLPPGSRDFCNTLSYPTQTPMTEGIIWPWVLGTHSSKEGRREERREEDAKGDHSSFGTRRPQFKLSLHEGTITSESTIKRWHGGSQEIPRSLTPLSWHQSLTTQGTSSRTPDLEETEEAQLGHRGAVGLEGSLSHPVPEELSKVAPTISHRVNSSPQI
jgi:hypothetical protein